MKSWILLFLACSPALSADVPGTAGAPTLRYMFPLSANKGSVIHAEVFGDALKDSYGVWFNQDGLSGLVDKVEANSDATLGPLKGPGDSGEKPPAERISITLNIKDSSATGVLELRLVTPRGLSTPIEFRVEPGSVILEAQKASGARSQPITPPAIINGRISKPGDVDYYEFQADKGQTFVFEALAAKGIKPELRLYRPSGSWLNPERFTPLLFREQQTSVLIPANARYTWTSDEKGSYLLAVGSLYGVGWSYFAYEVRCAPFDGATAATDDSTSPRWQERVFERPLSPNWMDQVRTRTVQAPKLPAESKPPTAGAPGPPEKAQAQMQVPSEPVVMPVPTREAEPNETPEQANLVGVPALIEGAIEKPRDIDFYKFSIKAGQRLAFEIETPAAKPPYFQPQITLLDRNGQEVLSNLEEHSAPIATDGHPISYLKKLVSKLVFTSQGDGDYTLKVRDLTSRYGGETYRYRLLIRPQIPHVGEISLKDANQLNLVRGEVRKVAITASAEEGFDGEIVYSFTGLPSGLEVFPGATAPPEKNPDTVEHEESFLPKRYEASVLLAAKADAALTRMPVMARLEFRPVVRGVLGPPHIVREIPVMIIEPGETKLSK